MDTTERGLNDVLNCHVADEASYNEKRTLTHNTHEPMGVGTVHD